jgi:hypothetical protein
LGGVKQKYRQSKSVHLSKTSFNNDVASSRFKAEPQGYSLEKQIEKYVVRCSKKKGTLFSLMEK